MIPDAAVASSAGSSGASSAAAARRDITRGPEGPRTRDGGASGDMKGWRSLIPDATADRLE